VSATEARRSPEEIARQGAALFECQVRPALSPQDDGKFVAIDIDSGAYEWFPVFFRVSRPLSHCAAAATG
jgi:hypothetical protein